MKPGTRIVSHAFDMGDWKPEVSMTNVERPQRLFLDRAGQGERHLEGRRRREQDSRSISTQKYQFFTGKAEMGGKTVDITDGRIKGAEISFTIDRGGKTIPARYKGTIDGGQIKDVNEGLAGSQVLMRNRLAMHSTLSQRSSSGSLYCPQDKVHERSSNPPAPRASLSVVDGALMMVGIIIGIGIFKTPQTRGAQRAERSLGSSAPGCWAVSSTLIGALVYAELAAAYPVDRRRISFPHPRLRPAGRLPVRLGAHHGDPDRRDRGGALSCSATTRSRLWSLGTYGSAIYAAVGACSC